MKNCVLILHFSLLILILHFPFIPYPFSFIPFFYFAFCFFFGSPFPGIPKGAVYMDALEKTTVAVLIPCFNEEVTVGKVIDDFRRVIPQAAIYVFDNNSTDATARLAREHGAVVLHEKRQGKGYVVQSMLQKIDADYYVMVDGDDTYSADHLWELLLPVVNDHADMTVGNRLQVYEGN